MNNRIIDYTQWPSSLIAIVFLFLLTTRAYSQVELSIDSLVDATQWIDKD